MAKFNPENERIKRAYLEWEKEANGKSDSTVINIREAIYLYEKFTQFKSFKLFCKDDAVAFKKHIALKKNNRSNELVSKTYLFHVMRNLQTFFGWLCGQPGYKKRINPSSIAYLRLSEKDMQIARSTKTKRVPTLEQLERVIGNMPCDTEIQKRDRAIVACLILTGCRVTALISLKLKHVSIEEQCIEQLPDEVKTKFGKKIVSYFFQVGDTYKEILDNWVNLLRNKKYYDDNAPLFPSTKLSLDENDRFIREELDVVHLKSTAPVRDILRLAFERVGLPYYNPHSFRDMLVRDMSKKCITPAQFKAVSQNIGHNNPLTTFCSYGTIDVYDQGEIIKCLGVHKADEQSLSREDIMVLKNLLANKDSSN